MTDRLSFFQGKGESDQLRISSTKLEITLSLLTILTNAATLLQTESIGKLSISIALICRKLVVACCLFIILFNTATLLQTNSIVILSISIALICRKLVVACCLFIILLNTMTILQTKSIVTLSSSIALVGRKLEVTRCLFVILPNTLTILETKSIVTLSTSIALVDNVDARQCATVVKVLTRQTIQVNELVPIRILREQPHKSSWRQLPYQMSTVEHPLSAAKRKC